MSYQVTAKPGRTRLPPKKSGKIQDPIYDFISQVKKSQATTPVSYYYLGTKKTITTKFDTNTISNLSVAESRKNYNQKHVHKDENSCNVMRRYTPSL